VLEREAALIELMRHFIDDIRNGVSPSEAGWVKKTPEVGKLHPELIEERNGNIRILIKEDISSSLRRLMGFPDREEVMRLADLCLDMSRMGEARDLLVNVVQRFEDSPQLEWSAVALGWQEMLTNIGGCVALDQVLEAGFNAVQWHKEAPKVSTELALSVARKWCNLEQTNIEELSKTLSLGLEYSSVNPEIVERVMRVLEWKQALKEFTKEESEALGLLWFSDKLLRSKGVFLPEVLFSVKEKTWKLISGRIGEEETEVMEKVDRMIDKLSNSSRRSNVVTVNWAEIVRPPW